ncbi:MAG: DUF1232 domain-containing protein [Firmicutes bacterium]|nr:DUF1232 domain-containing protein [Bacillota bacterium]
MQRITLALLLGRLKHIKNLLNDKTVAFWKKALVVFAIFYLFLPLDLIPPLIPVFGFLDDVTLWIGVLYLVWDELGKYGDPKDVSKAEKKKNFHGKNMVDGVEFEVKINEESEEDASV